MAAKRRKLKHRHKIEYVPISKLKLWDKNPRDNDKAAEKLCKLLEEHGFISPIIATPDEVIRAGNTRYKAAQKAGFTEVPVIYVPFGSEEEAEMFSLADNKASEWSKWTPKLLEELFNRNRSLSVDQKQRLSGFSRQELFKHQKVDKSDEDEVPKTSKEVFSKKGECYTLDKHFLFCMDSSKKAKLIGGYAFKTDTIFTDPPYGIEYQSRVDIKRHKDWGPIHGDGMEKESLSLMIRKAIKAIPGVNYIFICASWDSLTTMTKAMGNPRSICVWIKNYFGLGAGYRRQHELILFYGQILRRDLSDVWKFNRAKQYQHPTQKPVELVRKALEDVGAEVVYDPFCGSGTTFIAADQLDCKCIGAEIEPKYCDVIRRRWCSYKYGTEDDWQRKTERQTY